MDDLEFDALVNKIQGEVFAEAQNALGEKGFDRWRNPKFCGIIDNAHGHARIKGSCGDTMQMFLLVDGDRVQRVSYLTDGCSSSSIAGSFTAELAMGRSLTEVLDMTGADVLNEIGTFPEAEKHCAHLAVTTLHEAINSFMAAQIKKDPQKV